MAFLDFIKKKKLADDLVFLHDDDQEQDQHNGPYHNPGNAGRESIREQLEQPETHNAKPQPEELIQHQFHNLKFFALRESFFHHHHLR